MQRHFMQDRMMQASEHDHSDLRMGTIRNEIEQYFKTRIGQV